MRRFPPPPDGSKGVSTPTMKLRSNRSKEAPMQGFEWTSPRDFPASPFLAAATPSQAPQARAEDDGERARKRTHYEAMDVDTPPRPTLPPFPTDATVPTITNPFHFSTTPPLPASEPPHSLDFDPETFSPKKAFGLANASTPDGEPSDEEGEKSRRNAVDFVGGFKAETDGRRRRLGWGKDRSSERRKVSTASDDEEPLDSGTGISFGVNKAPGQRMGSSDFSFQVHHHHASSSASGGGLNEPAQRGKWLDTHTPYTLLGYLQFASLLFLSVLVLSLSLLFLYTLYTDVQSRLLALSHELRMEIHQCAKFYVDNRCEPKTRLPALEGKCRGWEECMGRDLVVVGKTRVVAETLAEIVNGFVDVISFKTMLFVLLTLSITIYGSTVALSRPTSPVITHHPSAPQPHFQNLGYHPVAPPLGYSPFGYHPMLSPSSETWMQEERGGMELGALPPTETKKVKKKGWLGL